jgi:arylsulfate sulfotransferase
MHVPCVRSSNRILIQIPVLVSIFTLPFCSPALTISSGPVVTPATNAPLAALLQLTTDDYSRVSVLVDDGQQTWKRDFFDYGTNHSVPLLGFHASRTNVITVTVHDRFGNEFTDAQPAVFVTGGLPSDFPKTVVLKSEPEKMEPGYMLFITTIRNSANRPVVTIIDNSGEVVWYSGTLGNAEVRQLDNGNLFLPLATEFIELNLLGDTVDQWVAPTNLPINFHEAFPTDHGTILYLSDASRVVTNLPTSVTNPNAPLQTTNVMYDKVVELSVTNGTLLQTWSPINMLDPTRVDYSSLSIKTTQGYDVDHANAIIEDPRDDSIIVSMRHQDAVVKFSRATGRLKWILGPHENWGPAWQPYLLTPVGEPFEWNYAQHAPVLTPQGTVLLYDDGNFRASPFDPPLADSNTYSRAVEFSINEKTMEVSQVWDFGRTNSERKFTPILGSTYPLPHTGNVLVDFGYITYIDGVHPSPIAPNASMVRIQEVTHDPIPETVFDLEIFDPQNTSRTFLGASVYRSHWIPDLYPVRTPTCAVADLIAATGMLPSRTAWNLIPNLAAAATSIGAHDPDTAVRSLEQFQVEIRRWRPVPDEAVDLDYQAQSIIDALNAGCASVATETLSTVFPVFQPGHGLADLIDTVGNARLRIGRSLLAGLSSALASLGENNPAATVRDLRTFQSLIPISPLNSNLARQFDFQAQRIIDVLGQQPDSTRCHLEMHIRGSKPCLEFAGNVTRPYSVEASSDMVHWKKIGDARPTANGNFEFDDADKTGIQARFYRVVSP